MDNFKSIWCGSKKKTFLGQRSFWGKAKELRFQLKKQSLGECLPTIVRHSQEITWVLVNRCFLCWMRTGNLSKVTHLISCLARTDCMILQSKFWTQQYLLLMWKLKPRVFNIQVNIIVSDELTLDFSHMITCPVLFPGDAFKEFSWVVCINIFER